MRIVKGCIVAALALAAGAWVEAARADEAYICDAGRVVYVKPGELEIKKLQDPCIAKYFEGTPTATKSVVATAPSASTAATPTAVQVPPKNGVDRPVPLASGDFRPAPLVSGDFRPAPLVSGDFRNVRIINASPGSDGWFVHRR
ncbi:MAG: hypothetical protein ABL904_18940 [Hyphomicrobiaceae bacterium]